MEPRSKHGDDGHYIPPQFLLRRQVFPVNDDAGRSLQTIAKAHQSISMGDDSAQLSDGFLLLTNDTDLTPLYLFNRSW